MATAVTTGAVALVLEAHRQADPGAPALTPNIVKGILQYSSLRLRDELGAEYDDLTQGAGSLNDHIVWGTTDSPNSTVWGNLAATESGSPDRAGR
jgi:hypothetical protein